MRRKSENDSSLELLLDTMCNTFGGVMFIAITLAVVIAGKQIAPKHETQSHIEDVRTLQSEIRALEIALQKTRDEKSALAQEHDLLRDDSRLEMIAEIAMLEDKLNGVTIQKELEEKKSAAVDAERAALLLELKKAEVALAQATAQRDDVQRQFDERNAKIDGLKQNIRKSVPRALEFRVLEEKQEVPYYIFLRGEKAWRVGPRQVAGKPQFEDDVTTNFAGRKWSFEILPDRGYNILMQGNVDPAFSRILSAVPAGRIPVFVVEASAAPTFYELRQQLKKQKIFHGFYIYPKLELFSLIMSSGVHYEY